MPPKAAELWHPLTGNETSRPSHSPIPLPGDPFGASPLDARLMPASRAWRERVAQAGDKSAAEIMCLNRARLEIAARRTVLQRLQRWMRLPSVTPS